MAPIKKSKIFPDRKINRKHSKGEKALLKNNKVGAFYSSCFVQLLMNE